MQRDILAGLTVGVMVVPQSISYASIANVPSQFGLYGASKVCKSLQDLAKWNL